MEPGNEPTVKASSGQIDQIRMLGYLLFAPYSTAHLFCLAVHVCEDLVNGLELKVAATVGLSQQIHEGTSTVQQLQK